MKKFILLITTYVFIIILSVQIVQAQWESCNNGLYWGSIRTLAVKGNYVFACHMGKGVYLSPNDNETF